MRILIVDDDARTRQELRSELESMGHDVVEAVDGTAGLDIMRSVAPELVLLDMVLEVPPSGWQVAKTKMQDPTIAAIPLIVMSFMPGENVRAEAHRQDHALSKALLFLQKPIDPSELQSAIRAVGSSLRPRR